MRPPARQSVGVGARMRNRPSDRIPQMGQSSAISGQRPRGDSSEGGQRSRGGAASCSRFAMRLVVFVSGSDSARLVSVVRCRCCIVVAVISSFSACRAKSARVPLKCFDALQPHLQLILEIDHSSGHTKKKENGLCLANMNLGYGGKQSLSRVQRHQQILCCQ